MVQEFPDIIKYLPEYQADSEMVLEAVIKNADMMQYVDKSLRDDKNFCQSAVQNRANILKYCSSTILKDKAFILLAIECLHAKYRDEPLRYADKSLQDDEVVVKAAITKKQILFLICLSVCLLKKMLFWSIIKKIL